MRFYRGLQPFKVMSFDLDDTLYDNSDVIRLAEERFLQCVQEHAQLSELTSEYWRGWKWQLAEKDPLIAEDVIAWRVETLRHLLAHHSKSAVEIDRTLERIKQWRKICPDLTLRSTFIVGFPGETEEDFQMLLDFLKEAQLDRVGCFKFSPVEGALATEMADQVPEDVKEERFHRFMQLQQEISAERLKQKIGQTLDVIVDEIDDEGIIGRTKADAPEVDGLVYIENLSGTPVKVGEFIKVTITHSDEYDLWGTC